MSEVGNSKIVQFDTNSVLGSESVNLDSRMGELKSSLDSGSICGSKKSPAQVYFNRHRIMECLEEAVHELALKLPEDPYGYLSDFFRSKSSTVSAGHTAEGMHSAIVTVCDVSVNTLAEEGKFAEVSTKNLAELVLPPEELDTEFVSYLSDLASSVRRGTT